MCLCAYVFGKHAEKSLVASALLIQQNNKPQGKPKKWGEKSNSLSKDMTIFQNIQNKYIKYFILYFIDT